MSNFDAIACAYCGTVAALNAADECESCYDTHNAEDAERRSRRVITDTPSLSDYRNEAGEWMASPEQIRADMNWQPDPADFYDDY